MKRVRAINEEPNWRGPFFIAGLTEWCRQVARKLNGIEDGATADGGGDVVGPASSTDGVYVLFDGTSGKLIKGATGTGWLRAVGGVYTVDTVALPASTETSGTLTIASAGRMVRATAGVTIPASVYAQGDAISIRNTTSSPITITQGSGMTLELAGTATTGSRTLAGKGLCTLWFDSSSLASCVGAGLT